MASQGAIILSYHDSLLRQTDVSTLQDGCWLNDNIISFVYDYFEHDQLRGPNGSVSFLSPDVAQFMKFASSEEIGLFLEPLSLNEKEYIFMVINDNSCASSAGGCHWSCLICNRVSKEFLHLDSSSSHNSQAAKAVSRVLNGFLKDAVPCTFREVQCPQQTNSCDCGVYSLCFSEIAATKLLKGATFSQDHLHCVTPEYVHSKRKSFRELIEELSSK